MSRFSLKRMYFIIAVAMALFITGPARAQFGVVLSGAGPTNRSMAGASTAAPLDASGALYWNPGAITGLGSSELGIGLEVLYPQTHLSSSLPANSFGPGIPPVPFSGRDRSDSGVFLLPTVGLVYQAPDSPLTYGLGLFSAGGFAVNYPASNTNPILMAQPPNGFGLGAINAELQVFQIVPTVACRITDRLSIGFAPTLSLARLMSDPAVLASPDDANGDGFFTYPSATHGRLEAGGGFQAGVFYNVDDAWSLGASVKSPQWFETFRYKSVDELGQPRTSQFRVDYPLMASVGVGYRGFERWKFAADFRYIDYANTPGFDGAGFDPATGALRGVGWDSIFAAAVGAQYELTPCTALRLGYSYNTNPIRDDRTAFNVESPLILQHTIYAGATFRVSQCFLITMAYVHAFENSITGPYVTPFGAVPDSSVQSSVSADTLSLGVTIKF